MENSLKNKAIRGVIWSGVERFSVQGVQFLVMLVIARILDPKDFGLVGMLAIFLAVAQSFIDSGFSQALIRKQDRTETDNSTVFYFNIAVSVVLYLLLFFIAPYVAVFYKEPLLVNLMRVLCLVIIIDSFAVVQRAIYISRIDFKTQARASFFSALISGLVGLYLAYIGFGVWTLVWQQILRSFMSTLLLWWYSSWRPGLIYSWKSFHQLFSFGSKLLISGLIDTVYNNIYQIVIGKIYNATSLGYYSQAQQISTLPSSNIQGVIGNVTYPVLSSIQNDDERLAVNYRKLLRVSAFIIFPLMAGLAAVARPLINIVLGAKWDYTAILLVPVCFAMMWYPVHAINLNLLKVKGRSDLFLKLEIIKKALGTVVLLLSIPLGLLAMCYGTILGSLLALYVNTYYTGKLINVGFKKQMYDLTGSLLISLSMFAIVYLLTCLIDGFWYQLIVGGGIGVVYFVVVCFLFKIKEIEYLKLLFYGR